MSMSRTTGTIATVSTVNSHRDYYLELVERFEVVSTPRTWLILLSVFFILNNAV